MRSLLPPLLVVAQLGCGGSPLLSLAVPPPDDPVAMLEEQTGSSWHVRFHDDVPTPAFLDGRTRPLLARPGSAVAAARGFIDAQRRLFRCPSADDELRSEGEERDELGMTHLRLAQHQGGVPVLDGGLVAHFDGEGRLIRLHGRYVPLPPVDLVPVALPADAKLAARLAVRRLLELADEAGFESERPRLVVDPGAWHGAWPEVVPDEPPRLAWQVEVRVEQASAPGRFAVLVDAATGKVYRTDELLDEVAGSGSGYFGERRPLEVSSRSGRFYLEDGREQPPLRTYSAGGSGRLPGTLVSSPQLDRWDEVGPAHGVAVDAHANLAATRAYFARVHGLAPLSTIATVHYGRGYKNAFWNGRQLVFGDGDGELFAPLAAALDVVAHEYAHAVIEELAGLGHSGEVGAVNEGLADLFACFTEQAVHGRTDFRIGERVTLRSPALRDLADPHRSGNPAHLRERIVSRRDRGAIHANATLVGHAGYLIAAGGTNSVSGLLVRGLGLSKTQRLFYRALVRYLGPRAGFADLADATVAAAQDLDGPGAAADTVAEAWRAVGVRTMR